MERFAAPARAGSAADPVTLARPGSILRQTVRVHERMRGRDALCELDGSGMRITGALGTRVIAWPDVRSVVADRGRVRVVSPSGAIVLSIALDGRSEPGLAHVFAQVLSDGRRGTQRSAGSLHELARAIDATVERFADADDPVLPLAIGGFAFLAGLIFVAAVPIGVQLAARITPAAGSFAIFPRVSGIDPRVIIASFAGGAALASLVARAALGGSASSWARGTLRGWHRNASGLEGSLRAVVAGVVLYPRVALVIAALALLVILPSAFARTVLDGSGIHVASGLPLLSTDISWSAVADVVPVAVGFGERQEGFTTDIVLVDGAHVSTRGRDLAGGSERALYDFSRAHAR